MLATPDHPRSRGVYSLKAAGFDDHKGSSPLARGLRAGLGHAHHGRGIIPARAGFTGRDRPRRRDRRDHPRSRGVYTPPTVRDDSWYGSSPLARGLPVAKVSAILAPRIIPARAGFTCSPGWPAPRSGDHPRSRGVYVVIPGLLPFPARIIPARAGFTLPPAHSPISQGDHPRSRGVYQDDVSEITVASGSSPLARGLLHDGGDRLGL